MLVLMGIIVICIIFIFLRDLDKAKFRKRKDAFKTNFLKFKYKYQLNKPKNKVHFYVVRDEHQDLSLWLGKPRRGQYGWTNTKYATYIAMGYELCIFGLNIEDYASIKYGDEPIEVFLSIE